MQWNIFCLGIQYQKIAMESSIMSIDSHIIPHFKAYVVYYMFSLHVYDDLHYYVELALKIQTFYFKQLSNMIRVLNSTSFHHIKKYGSTMYMVIDGKLS